MKAKLIKENIINGLKSCNRLSITENTITAYHVSKSKIDLTFKNDLCILLICDSIFCEGRMTQSYFEEIKNGVMQIMSVENKARELIIDTLPPFQGLTDDVINGIGIFINSNIANWNQSAMDDISGKKKLIFSANNQGYHWNFDDGNNKLFDHQIEVYVTKATSEDELFNMIDIAFASLNGGDLERFFNGYKEAAFWTEEEPHNLISDNDFSSDAISKMMDDCKQFFSNNFTDLKKINEDFSQHGHDFWLTRNGHGAGFWDRGYNKAIADRLTANSEKFGVAYLFNSDDGKHIECERG